nr:unnamed protein product [Callosobruchus chinensis]
MPISGFIIASKSGWPPSIYLFGILGYTWMLFWYFFGADCPAKHSKITQEEKEYIEQSLNVTKDEVRAITPWRSILTSFPVWAFIIAMIGESWLFTMLHLEIPNYMDKIVGVDMKLNGLLSAAPYLANFILGFLVAVLCDCLINRGFVSRGIARNIFNSVGTCSPAIALIALSFLPENATLTSEILLIVAVGVNSGVCAGYKINPVDLAPNYSGIIMGLGSGISQVISSIQPIVFHSIVTNEFFQNDKSSWAVMFLAAALLMVCTNLFFVCNSSGEVQPWNNTAKANRTSENNVSTTNTPVDKWQPLSVY